MPHDYINEAQQALLSGQSSLNGSLPALVYKIINEGLWEGRTKKDGTPFKSFKELCEYKLWWGLETPYERMLKYCEHKPDTYALLLRELPEITGHGEIGNGRSRADNISSTSEPKHGTGSTYTLRRLKRDRPDLARQVIDGLMTANAAAIAAGIRLKTVSIPADPVRAAATIRKSFDHEFVAQLIRELEGSHDHQAA